MNKQLFLILLASLFAIHVQAEITALDFSPAALYEGTQVTVTPTIASVPDGNVYVCWGLYSDSGCTNELDTVVFSNENAQNAVSFAAPAVAGTYYVKCALHTGGRCNGLMNTSFVSPMVVVQASETPTRTDDISSSSYARKLFMDGALYIVRDGKIYDARGIRVE